MVGTLNLKVNRQQVKKYHRRAKYGDMLMIQKLSKPSEHMPLVNRHEEIADTWFLKMTVARLADLTSNILNFADVKLINDLHAHFRQLTKVYLRVLVGKVPRGGGALSRCLGREVLPRCPNPDPV